jgi:hypothetical protein
MNLPGGVLRMTGDNVGIGPVEPKTFSFADCNMGPVVTVTPDNKIEVYQTPIEDCDRDTLARAIRQWASYYVPALKEKP